MSTTSSYTLVRCYRIVDHASEDSIIRSVTELGGAVEYRLDCVDIYLAESAGLVWLLLRWASSLQRLEHLEYNLPVLV